MNWRLVFSKHARRNAKKLAASGLKPRAQELLALLHEDPPRLAIVAKDPRHDLIEGVVLHARRQRGDRRRAGQAPSADQRGQPGAGFQGPTDRG